MRINLTAVWMLAGLIVLACILLLRDGPGYADQDREQVFSPATAHHLTGTDSLGRDRLVRVSAALLLSLVGAIAAAALSTAAAAVIGGIAAFSPQWLSAPHEDLGKAKALLAGAGFRLNGAALADAGGHPVKFSILTNSGNAARLKMATLIQQDLKTLGIEVTVVTLDFPSLIERLMHTQDYEACLLGLENVDPDPNAMMNVWLSSSPNHQWNLSEKTPATPWEAEIDRVVTEQASSLKQADRKHAVDRLQQIVADQQPFIYLVYPNNLVAVSPKLQGTSPALLDPGVVWNVESLYLQGTR